MIEEPGNRSTFGSRLHKGYRHRARDRQGPLSPGSSESGKPVVVVDQPQDDLAVHRMAEDVSRELQDECVVHARINGQPPCQRDSRERRRLRRRTFRCFIRGIERQRDLAESLNAEKRVPATASPSEWLKTAAG